MEAEAVAVKDGKIQAVGTLSQLISLKDSHTNLVDLNGATLIHRPH